MSLAGLRTGDRRDAQGDFGEMWLEAVAAGCGFDHGPPHKNDRIKADVQLGLRERINRTNNPQVWVQVKTTVEPLRDHNGTHWAYDLDVETHDVLRDPDERIRRILAVIQLSANGETIRMEPDGTLLVGATAWVSLENEPASANATRQVVYLPKHQVLDPTGLRHMLTTYGLPATSSVPDIDCEWR